MAALSACVAEEETSYSVSRACLIGNLISLVCVQKEEASIQLVQQFVELFY